MGQGGAAEWRASLLIRSAAGELAGRLAGRCGTKIFWQSVAKEGCPVHAAGPRLGAHWSRCQAPPTLLRLSSLQVESTMALQSLQPRVKELQAKYANDAERLQVGGLV